MSRVSLESWVSMENPTWMILQCQSSVCFLDGVLSGIFCDFEFFVWVDSWRFANVFVRHDCRFSRILRCERMYLGECRVSWVSIDEYGETRRDDAQNNLIALFDKRVLETELIRQLRWSSAEFWLIDQASHLASWEFRDVLYTWAHLEKGLDTWDETWWYRRVHLKNTVDSLSLVISQRTSISRAKITCQQQSLKTMSHS